MNRGRELRFGRFGLFLVLAWQRSCCLCIYKGKNKEQLFLAIPCFYAHNNPVARPRINPEKHRQNVAITLDPELLLRTRALAALKGRSLSQLLDSLLQRWIEEQEPSDAEMECAIDAYIENHERQESLKDKLQAKKKGKTTKSRA